MRTIKAFCLCLFSLLSMAIYAAGNVTHTFDFAKGTTTVPFVISKGGCEFVLEISCKEENSEICVELMGMDNQRIAVLCDLKGEKEGNKRLRVTSSYQGNGYLKVTRKGDITCSVRIIQNLSSFTVKQWQLAEGKLLNHFEKMATWTGRRETVTYEIYCPAPATKLIVVSGIPKEIAIRVVNEAGEVIIDFEEKVTSDRHLIFYNPGTYRITIASQHAWILHVLSMKGN